MKTSPTLLSPHRPLLQTFPAPNAKEKERNREGKIAKAGTTTYLGNNRPRPPPPPVTPPLISAGVVKELGAAAARPVPSTSRGRASGAGASPAALRSRAPETLGFKMGSKEARSTRASGSAHRRSCAAGSGFPRSLSRPPGGFRARSLRTRQPGGSTRCSPPTSTPGMLSKYLSEGEGA